MGPNIHFKIILLYPSNLKCVPYETKSYHSNEVTVNRNWNFSAWQFAYMKGKSKWCQYCYEAP